MGATPMSTSRPRRYACIGAASLALCMVASACGGGDAAAPAAAADTLMVSPQNSTFLIGTNRLSFALNTPDTKAVLGAAATWTLQRRGGASVAHGALQFIGPEYGQIPVYLGVGRFPQTGEWEFVVHAVTPGGSALDGHAFVNVTTQSPELPVGFSVTKAANIRQRVARDVAGDLSQLDSAVKDGKADPDPFHDFSIQDGLDQHKSMVLYFGEPGRCVSQTCGPTVQVLEKLYPQYRDRFLFEHIEVHDPASGDAFNPVYVAFGLQSEPWVYVVNSQGIVSDRFEGPLTVEQLQGALDGTLAGKVPAVDVSTS